MLGLFTILFYAAHGLFLREGEDVRAMINIGETQIFDIPTSILEPSSQYEVRISYLGTVAGNFELSWACPTSGRKLLDTEKLVFTTTESLQLTSRCSKISVKASRNSRSISTEVSQNPIWFNIRLDKFNPYIPVPSSVINLMLSFPIIILLIIVLYMYIKSQLGLNSDLKLQSPKSH